MRPMGPVYSNRTNCCPGTRLSSYGVFRKLEVSSLQKFFLIRIVVFLIGAATPSPTLALPQGQTSIPDVSTQQVISGDTTSSEDSLFAIDNPRNQPIPVSEAKTIYLSACRVVEQEFSRTDPIRPRLRLLLGSETDRVYYPKREIQLTKWDKYKFAQGVVMLATDSMLPQDKKFELSKLALVEAETVVDVRDLKNSGTPLRARPRN